MLFTNRNENWAWSQVRRVWIVQHVLSVCFRQIECLKIAFGTNVDLHMRWTKLINWKFVWLASSGKKFIYGRLKLLIQLIGSTRPKFDVSPNRRSWFNVGRPKLEFGSSHEKFDVWPRSIRRDHETIRERKHFPFKHPGKIVYYKISSCVIYIFST